MSLFYYVVDTETSGLKAEFHEIIELSFIRFSDRNQLTRKIRAEFPERANPESLKAIGRTPKSLREGISKEEAVNDLLSFLEQDQLTPEHRVIIAHNAPFDRRFLHALFKSVGKELPINNWLCTQKLARQETKKLGIVKPKLTLEASLGHFNIEPFDGQNHTALQDSRNLYKLAKYFFDNNINYVSKIERKPHNLNVTIEDISEND